MDKIMNRWIVEVVQGDISSFIDDEIEVKGPILITYLTSAMV
jgi:hypothetical protein